MSPQAEFAGGGPLDGDSRPLPHAPDTYEVVAAGTTWVYERTSGPRDDPAHYQLQSRR